MLNAHSNHSHPRDAGSAYAIRKNADKSHNARREAIAKFTDGNVKKQSDIKPTNALWGQLVAGNSAATQVQRKCDECEQNQEEQLHLQTKLNVGPVNDIYEREADTVADQVMNSQASSIGTISNLKPRQASAKFDTSEKSKTPQASGNGDRLTAYVGSLDGKGKSLSKAENHFFSSRFSRSFDSVRLHTNSEANQAAKGIHAKAFTYGNHIVFNQGNYQRNQPKSMNLLAHELTHVVQQGGASGAINRKPDNEVGTIQRTAESEVTPQQVGQDPGLLLCFILCELGVPPSIWRDLTGLVLQAVWEEYKVRYSQAQATVAFRRFELAFKSYSAIKVIHFILNFIVQGKIGFIPVRAASAAAIRRRLEAMLIRRGATSAGIIAAEQIARKVVIVIEIAIAAGCGLYCSTLALARSVVALIEAAAQGITALAEGLETAGEIMGSIVGGIATELFVRPIFTSLAIADVYNWDLSGMPASTRADTLVMGWYLSSQLDGPDMDTLLTQLAVPINRYPNDFQDLVFMTMAEIAEERDRLNEPPLGFSVYSILRESPITFIRLLNEEGYLQFMQDPNDVADAMIYGGEESQTQD